MNQHRLIDAGLNWGRSLVRSQEVGAAKDYRRLRGLIVGVPTIGVVLYSMAVLWHVATTGGIGLHCVFGPKVQEVERAYLWSTSEREVSPDARGPRPPQGDFSPGPPRGKANDDELTMVAGRSISNYTDYIHALRRIGDRHTRPDLAERFVEVRWEGVDGEHYGYVAVQPPPPGRYAWSVAWFVQEAFIFAIGAWVFWRRPNDESAQVFFWLCVVTVIAYMGGYHWGQIAKNPPLIFLFAAFVVFVPILSLHFYLIFPRPHPVLSAHRRRIMTVLYGIPTLTASALWATMFWSRWGTRNDEQVRAALEVLKWLALGYIGVSALIFLLCLACLVYSYHRQDLSRAERNQVRWVLLATFLALLPITWLLWDTAQDPARLGLSRSAWPMFLVSLFYTVAYAFSITRYKLMQAEALYNRGRFYVLASMMAGLLYSGGLVVGALMLGEQLKGEQSTLGTVVACATALVLLALLGAGRRWFQAALDRRFHREKYMFDQAMAKMSQAVDSLVDRATLGRRLLDAAGEVLRLEWGAIYLGPPGGGPLDLAACSGPEPDERTIDPGNPLIDHLRREPTPLRSAHGIGLGPTEPAAADALIALGGEVAVPLLAEGVLVGLLVLGPKRSGLPYEDEEIAFVAALGSVAVLALRSADIQQTLERLNRELREKVEKVAEQQRRILILQDQLAGRAGVQAESGSAGEGALGAASAPEPTDDEAVAAAAFAAIKGSGPSVRRMIAMARKVAASRAAVLIRGESGTGKELLAEAIHRASSRAGRPFVKVHCAALSQGLLESELFGHVRGAFTDARADRVGRFEQADGGTLFLDEIGDINLEVQTKLLRVLQETQFERVGSSQTIRVDVRILAATHQDLEALIRAGRFREDLYYRLNVISLRTPALRERREDIFELAVSLLNLHARRIGKAVTQIGDAAVEALMAYDWPGNVRELENVIERAVVLADGPAVTLRDLPPELTRPSPGAGRRRVQLADRSEQGRRRRPSLPHSPPALAAAGGPAPTWEPAVAADPAALAADDEPDPEYREFEHSRLLDALAEARGNKSEAARLLGLPRSTFFSKLKKYGLS